jgi:hypothetical protein
LTWNGTNIGVTRQQTFIPSPILRPIWDEVWGSYRDVIYCGERVLFKAVLRYPDADAIAACAFFNSGATWVFRPGGTTSNTRAGTSLGSTSGTLEFVPRAVSDHPGVKLYNAVPAIDEAAELQFSLGVEYGLAVAFYGTPNTSGQNYESGVGL